MEGEEADGTGKGCAGGFAPWTPGAVLGSFGGLILGQVQDGGGGRLGMGAAWGLCCGPRRVGLPTRPPMEGLL